MYAYWNWLGNLRYFKLDGEREYKVLQIHIQYVFLDTNAIICTKKWHCLVGVTGQLWALLGSISPLNHWCQVCFYHGYSTSLKVDLAGDQPGLQCDVSCHAPSSSCMCVSLQYTVLFLLLCSFDVLYVFVYLHVLFFLCCFLLIPHILCFLLGQKLLRLFSSKVYCLCLSFIYWLHVSAAFCLSLYPASVPHC